MAILGIGVTGLVKEAGGGAFFVEYHRCDNCETEYKLYFKSEKELKDALATLAVKLESMKEDLCYSCQSEVPEDQMVMSL